MIDERKNVQTAPTRAYCKCSRPLPYSNPNLQDAPALEVYPGPSHHPTTPNTSGNTMTVTCRYTACFEALLQWEHNGETNTVELQWLEHWWLVYRAYFELVFESLGRNPIAAEIIILGIIQSDFSYLYWKGYKGMFCVLIRIASMRRF